MHFSQLVLPSHDVNAQADFYGKLFGLPVTHDAVARRITVQVGSTQLIFEQTEAVTGRYHFAFNVPRNQFDQAQAWLAERTPLLAFEGKTQFHADRWQADICYFYDASGNIGELIARHTLSNDHTEPFTAAALLCVSEIGVGVEDVQAATEHLTARYGIPTYHSEPNSQFMSMGDEHGLLIVVDQARTWYPGTGIVAGRWPLQLTFDGQSLAADFRDEVK